MNSTLKLMDLYAAHRGVALSTLGRLMVRSSTLADRIACGRVTIATVERIHQWLSDRWPDEDVLPWPHEEIPRPPRRRPENEAA